MTPQQTFDILKYGYMDPTKAKNIISDYFEKIELEKYEYWSGWLHVDNDYAGHTHFMDLTVKHEDGKVLIELVPCDDDLTQHMLLDITNLNPEQVEVMFDDYFTELRKICQKYEYDQNYPDNDWEQ